MTKAPARDSNRAIDGKRPNGESDRAARATERCRSSVGLCNEVMSARPVADLRQVVQGVARQDLAVHVADVLGVLSLHLDIPVVLIRVLLRGLRELIVGIARRDEAVNEGHDPVHRDLASLGAGDTSVQVFRDRNLTLELDVPDLVGLLSQPVLVHDPRMAHGPLEHLQGHTRTLDTDAIEHRLPVGVHLLAVVGLELQKELALVQTVRGTATAVVLALARWPPRTLAVTFVLGFGSPPLPRQDKVPLHLGRRIGVGIGVGPRRPRGGARSRC